MRRLLLCAAACALLVSASVLPAAASGTVNATSTVSLSHDPGFEGLYKYTVTATWTLDRHELGHLDLFLDVATFADTCNGSAVVFPVPAGTSTGEDALEVPCEASYRGEFLCKTDPSIQFPDLGATIKYEPIELGCSVGIAGTARFVFYSSVPPAEAILHEDAVALKHGTEVEFGGLFGSIPSDPAHPAIRLEAPVVINEFLVLPYGEDKEFVELFNRTGQDVNLNGWSLEIYDRDSSFVSYTNFGPTDSLPPGGFQALPDSVFYGSCVICSPADPLGQEGALAGSDFLFDAGGIIYLKDDNGQVVDRVGYGNAGGAPISCPLVVPAGFAPPPGFSGSPGPASYEGVALTPPDTVSTSTNRVPDGMDTNSDAADFNLGSPTPQSANLAAIADLGSSTRINGAYVYPSIGDPDVEAYQLFNRTGQILDIRNAYLSDGYLVQPIFAPGAMVPLEPDQKYMVTAGKNCTSGFDFQEDDRMDLYEMRPEGLVRIDQLGWMMTTPYFPDECMTRSPDGWGPTGGWDWDTSGGYVTLFYDADCLMQASSVVAVEGAPAVTSFSAPWPNPARGAASFAFTVGKSQGATAGVAVYDVAGRRVRVVGQGTYVPGRHVVSWDGATDGGRPAGPGVYFARLLLAGRPVGQARPLVWLGE